MNSLHCLRLYFVCVSLLSFTTLSLTSAPYNCQKGCKSNAECPKNAHCASIAGANDCGVCLCNDGYAINLFNNCKLIRKPTPVKSKKAPTTTAFHDFQQITTTTPYMFQVATTTASAPKSQISRVPRPPGFVEASPNPEPIECSHYDCGTEPEGGNDSLPMRIRTQKVGPTPVGCKNKIVHDKVNCQTRLADSIEDCAGVYCLQVTTEKSYCICPYEKIGSGCHEYKPGKCASATGEVPESGYISTDKRFSHILNPDLGDIMGRHFALDLEQCIRLCQWTAGRCRSVNYGPMNGRKVCELLSIKVLKGSAMDTNVWMKNAPGWTYACCFSKY